MDNLNQLGLKIVGINATDENGEQMTDKRGRKGKQLVVSPVYEGGILSNQKRYENVWEDFTDEYGNEFKGDQLFYGAKVGNIVAGEIRKVEIEDFWIESENGKDTHPETGKPANKINETTVVLFDGDTVQSKLSKGQKLKGDETPAVATPAQQPQKTSPVIQDELEEEDEQVELS